MKTPACIAIVLLMLPSSRALDLDHLVTPETLMTFRETLGFSAEQEAELSRIYETAKSEAETLEASVKREEEALNTKLRSDALDAAEAEASFNGLLAAETKLKQLQFKTLLSLRAVLTPEQVTKAVAIEGRSRQENGPLKLKIEEKAERLRLAFEALDVKPAPELVAEGEQIRIFIRTGELEAADKALDALGEKVGIDEDEESATIDFSQQDPGDIELNVLESRYRAVENAAQRVIHLPTIRNLLQARDAIEAAKTSEDAEAVGRVLTWAEQVLGLTTAP